MNITPTQLARRVEKWQRLLPLLGVGHWRIDSVVICDETPGGPNAKASAGVSHYYDSVTFWFTHSCLDAVDERGLDETIIHEWLHVVMRDMDAAIGDAEESMAREEKRQWIDRVDHAREGLVERLARQLYDALS